jgi:hypothetical protein
MLYADDIFIIQDTEGRLLNDCVRRVNKDVECVNEWLTCMGLSIIKDKCSVMAIGSRRTRAKFVGAHTNPVSLDGSPISYVTHLHYLGVSILCDLSW